MTPVTPDGGTTTATTTATTLGLGEEADEVWAEVLALWEETGTYRAHEVQQETLARAQGRIAGLLLRLGAVDGVLREAPGLLELLGVEFDERLALEPAEAACATDDGMRTAAGRAWERLAERVDWVEALAAGGYGNAWLREQVLPRMREDARAVRAAAAEGDGWRTEDERVRAVPPAETDAVLDRVEAALSVLAER